MKALFTIIAGLITGLGLMLNIRQLITIIANREKFRTRGSFLQGLISQIIMIAIVIGGGILIVMAIQNSEI